MLFAVLTRSVFIAFSVGEIYKVWINVPTEQVGFLRQQTFPCRQEISFFLAAVSLDYPILCCGILWSFPILRADYMALRQIVNQKLHIFFIFQSFPEFCGDYELFSIVLKLRDCSVIHLNLVREHQEPIP